MNPEQCLTEMEDRLLKLDEERVSLLREFKILFYAWPFANDKITHGKKENSKKTFSGSTSMASLSSWSIL
jgi:hypothetical protein